MQPSSFSDLTTEAEHSRRQRRRASLGPWQQLSWLRVPRCARGATDLDLHQLRSHRRHAYPRRGAAAKVISGWILVDRSGRSPARRRCPSADSAQRRQPGRV